MKILLALIVFSLYTLHAEGQDKFASCSRKWTKIGCFKDEYKRKSSRPLPEMLLNDRDKRSKYHEKGYRLNWHRWTESTHSLACRCAEKAKQKGYTVFGLQFYGECWSGPSAELNFNRDGGSDKCIMNLDQPTECDDQGTQQECVGQQETNYIYKLTENAGPQTPDTDGRWSSWSEWSECSKTCGGGEKVRERSCTNPAPQGNGQPCVGDPEDVASCNTQECNQCSKMMDVGIILDSSSSVRRDNYETVKKFLIKLVDNMDVNQRTTHVGIIHYNHRPFLDWNFNSDVAKNHAALKEAISKLRYQPGGTRTDKGMDLAAAKMFKPEFGERPNVPHVALVITDGKTSLRSKKYSEVLKPFVDEGVKVIAVGVGPSVDFYELKQIAMGNEKYVVQVSQFDDLVTKIKEIIRLSCAARKLL